MPLANRRTFLAQGLATLAIGGSWNRLASVQADPEKSAVDSDYPRRCPGHRARSDRAGPSAGRGGGLRLGGLQPECGRLRPGGHGLYGGRQHAGRGPFGQNVDRCVDFILANTQESGFINVSNASSHGPMYGHGFATLFLAECYGMTMRSDIREKLTKAVNLIVNTQNSEGGWRYQPQRRDADISVTICQVMALRAARNAGLYVPRETIDRCTEYVKLSQNPDGGFMYMLQGGGQSAFPRSAAGVVALYSAGIYDSPEIKKGLDYLLTYLPRGNDFNRESHYFYGHYYAVQAMWHAGGDYWTRWYPAIRDALVARQGDDGTWMDSICAEYGTAMACIILQMPNNYLPIFQR